MDSEMNNELRQLIGADEPLYEPELVFSEKDIKVEIEGQTKSITLQCNLEIWDNVFKLYSSPNLQLEGTYSNVQTIGAKENTLILFMDDPNNMGEEDEDDEEEMEELTTSDELISLIQQKMEGNFMLQGKMTVHLELPSGERREEVYGLVGGFVGEDDLGGDMGDDLEEMIGPDDIDEDGNVIKKFKEDEDSDDDDECEAEGEDEEEEEEGKMEDEK